MAIRYSLEIPRLPDTCTCGDKFTVDHAMICKKGGHVSQRHNELRDTTGQMLKAVCRTVQYEPTLQQLTGETFKWKTTCTSNNARLDLSAESFWTRGERAYFDVRVFDPVAQSHIDQELDAVHRSQEREKCRTFEERITEVEHGSFNPLVLQLPGECDPPHVNSTIDSPK